MAARRRFRRQHLQPRGMGVPFFLSCLTFCSAVAAQQPSSPSPPYTFRIYEDLVQMPTLVMNSLHKSESGLQANQFTLSLDSGPPFHPRHSRIEGDDPLTIALVLDTSSSSTARLAAGFASGEVTLPADWLSARDHITVYALDCALTRSTQNSQFTPALLRDEVNTVLNVPSLHNGSTKPHCGSDLDLWGALAMVVRDLGGYPGRRAMLVITDGENHRSLQTWNELAIYAGRYSVAMIGLRPAGHLNLQRDNLGWYGIAQPVSPLAEPEEIFGILCGETGGLVLPVQTQSLVPQLERSISLLRSRYILEFARPRNGTSGLHQIQATLNDPKAIIRTAGLTFPIQDKALLLQPNTLPNDPSRAPQLGERRILTQPH